MISGQSSQNLKVFDILSDMKITPQDSPERYAELIKHIDALSKSFKTLEKSGFTYKIDKGCYDSVISNAKYADLVPKLFRILKNAGLTLQDNNSFYQWAIKRGAYPYLIEVFEILTTLGILYLNDSKLYWLVIKSDERQIQAFEALKKAGMNFQEDQILYLWIFRESRFETYRLATVFIALKKAGISLLEYRELYQSVAFSNQDVGQIPIAFEELKNADMPFHENKILYIAIINKVDVTNQLVHAFKALKKVGIEPQQHPQWYDKIIDEIKYANNLSQEFDTLKEWGLTFKSHPDFYLEVINHLSAVNSLSAAFETLQTVGIALLSNAEYYKAIIRSSKWTHKLKIAIKTFKDFSITFNENPELFLMIINAAHHANKIAKGFGAFKKFGITLEKNREYYQAAIERSSSAHKLPSMFTRLENDGIIFQKNPEHYYAMLNNIHFWNEISQAFNILDNANINFQKYPAFYLAVINETRYTNKLPRIFEILINANILFHDNHELYLELLCKVFYIDQVEKCLTHLAKANIPSNKNKELYLSMILYHEYIDELIAILNIFQGLGIHYTNQPEHFNSYLLLVNSKLTHYMLSELRQVGFSWTTHQNLFNTLLQLLSNPQTTYQIVVNIVNKICLTGVSAKINDNKILNNLIDSAITHFHLITYGPLNKTNATRSIEKLLEDICDPNFNSHLEYNSPSYTLTISNQLPINLSLLIHNSNLSHLMLNQHLAEKLFEKLNILIKNKLQINTQINDIVKLLPLTHQNTIKLYISNKNYKNINKFFRSEFLKDELLSDNESDSFLGYFIIGCLLNDAANKIPCLVDEQPEKNLLDKIIHHYRIEMDDHWISSSKLSTLLQSSYRDDLIDGNTLIILQRSLQKLRYFYPSQETRFDRGEFLDDDVIKRRVANPWRLPSFTSFSAAKNGSKYFHKSGTVRTVLENSPHRYIINDVEQEVVLPQGTQLVTNQLKNHSGEITLVSTVCRSPCMEQGNHYWSESALCYAFEKYFNKPYSQVDHSLKLKGILIARPNHGLAHTYRIMLAIPWVVQYFSCYAKSLHFKEFCESLSDLDLEWLRVAAVFSITGRENEMSAIENLDLYDTFRQASSEHFREFVEKTAPMNSEIMSERMLHVVRYMGNPNYEISVTCQAINNHQDGNERILRNYYHRILSIAHKLDLPRCYSADKFNKSMAFCQALSLESMEQRQYLNEIIHYMINLIKIHGNRLSCDIQPNGDLIDANLRYQNIFSEVSQSWKKCFERSEMVARPQKKSLEISKSFMK